jgi:polyisoprenoid-binding protein YceI
VTSPYQPHPAYPRRQPEAHSGIPYGHVPVDQTQLLGDKPVAVEGKLTLKGVTRPVTLTVSSMHAMPQPMLKKDAIGANVTVKRTDFNAGKYAPYVGDVVRIDIALEAIKE